jgi:murein tripeptide amidase MpaA
VIAQQHPGEAMAGWLVEGLVLALTGGRGHSKELLEHAVVSIVPRMNPDGVAAGNHRTTPAGVDLNRAWGIEDAPIEVRCVRDAMRASGAALFLDVHGDERLPWVFTQSADPGGRSAAIAKQEARFEQAMTKATPDFQTKHEYPSSPSSKPNLAFASTWAQVTLGCLAMILEMPFSDHLGRPDPRGFSPDRARALGRALTAGLRAALTG